MASCGAEPGLLDKLQVTWDDSDTGRGPVGRAIREGTLQVWSSRSELPEDAVWKAGALARGCHATISMPVILGGTNIGVLTICAASLRYHRRPTLTFAPYRTGGRGDPMNHNDLVQRRLARVVTLPSPEPGFLGPGHTAIEVLTPRDLAGNDPFVLLMDDRLDLDPEVRTLGGAHPHAGLETVTLLLEGALGEIRGAYRSIDDKLTALMRRK